MEAVVEAGANYIFHLLALSGIGFSGQYVKRHFGSVSPSHLSVLREHRDALCFGDGRSGDLVYLLIFFPAYMNLDSPEKISEYFDLLTEGLARGDCSGFTARYSEALSRQREWTHSIDERWILQNHLRYLPAIERVGQVYCGAMEEYLSGVWPQESGEIADVAADLNRYLAEADLISRWEELLGLHFKMRPYQIVLVSAIEGGPNANSLGYERNVFYSGDNPEHMRRFISHEVGTHLMFPMANAIPGRWSGSAYRAFECLALFYNSIILGMEDPYPMGKGYDAHKFLRIYRGLRERCPGISPGTMLSRGIALYDEMG